MLLLLLLLFLLLLLLLRFFCILSKDPQDLKICYTVLRSSFRGGKKKEGGGVVDVVTAVAAVVFVADSQNGIGEGDAWAAAERPEWEECCLQGRCGKSKERGGEDRGWYGEDGIVVGFLLQCEGLEIEL